MNDASILSPLFLLTITFLFSFFDYQVFIESLLSSLSSSSRLIDTLIVAFFSIVLTMILPSLQWINSISFILFNFVDLVRLELTASWLQTKCSCHLSYKPLILFQRSNFSTTPLYCFSLLCYQAVVDDHRHLSTVYIYYYVSIRLNIQPMEYSLDNTHHNFYCTNFLLRCLHLLLDHLTILASIFLKLMFL